MEPASWRIVRRSSCMPKTTSVETTKLGTRTEWTCVPSTVRAARLLRPVEVLDRMAQLGPADLPEPLGQLARRAARDVGLGRARVVDDLPVRQVAGGEQRGGLAHRGGEREVARRRRRRRSARGPRGRAPRSPRRSAPTCRSRPPRPPRSPPARSASPPWPTCSRSGRRSRRAPRPRRHGRGRPAPRDRAPRPGRGRPRSGSRPSRAPGRARPARPARAPARSSRWLRRCTRSASSWLAGRVRPLVRAAQGGYRRT